MRAFRFLTIVMLSIASAAPTCDGASDAPAPAEGCGPGTKKCGAGCIFDSWICCGGGEGMCNPVTAAPGLTDGACPAPTAAGQCGDAKFCCAGPTGSIGSTDCAPPKHFCASPTDGTTICIDAPCTVETPPPSAGSKCPPGFAGSYAGKFTLTYGKSHKDSMTYMTVKEEPVTYEFNVSVTLECFLVLDGKVHLTPTKASITGGPAESYFGCVGCKPEFGSQFIYPESGPPPSDPMGLALLLPNGTSITTFDVVRDGSGNFSSGRTTTCDGGSGTSTWTSGGGPNGGIQYAVPSDRVNMWCENETHWSLQKQ